MAEAEVAAKAVTKVVAVEPVGEATGGEQMSLYRGGGRGLPGARQAGEPDRCPFLPEAVPALAPVEDALLPGHIGGASVLAPRDPLAERRIEHAH